MFKLVAILYLVVNGQTATEPTAVLSNRVQFSSEETCMNYFDTPDGMASKVTLMALINAQDEAFKVEFKCVPVPDNTI